MVVLVPICMLGGEVDRLIERPLYLSSGPGRGEYVPDVASGVGVQ